MWDQLVMSAVTVAGSGRVSAAGFSPFVWKVFLKLQALEYRIHDFVPFKYQLYCFFVF